MEENTNDSNKAHQNPAFESEEQDIEGAAASYPKRMKNQNESPETKKYEKGVPNLEDHVKAATHGPRPSGSRSSVISFAEQLGLTVSPRKRELALGDSQGVYQNKPTIVGETLKETNAESDFVNVSVSDLTKSTLMDDAGASKELSADSFPSDMTAAFIAENYAAGTPEDFDSAMIALSELIRTTSRALTENVDQNSTVDTETPNISPQDLFPSDMTAAFIAQNYVAGTSEDTDSAMASLSDLIKTTSRSLTGSGSRTTSAIATGTVNQSPPGPFPSDMTASSIAPAVNPAEDNNTGVSDLTGTSEHNEFVMVSPSHLAMPKHSRQEEEDISLSFEDLHDALKEEKQ